MEYVKGYLPKRLYISSSLFLVSVFWFKQLQCTDLDDKTVKITKPYI